MPQHLSIGDWFELDIADGRATIRGECDLATASPIQPWLAIFDGHPLDIDLSEVTGFDAAALRAFLEMRQRNPRLRVINPSPAVQRIFEMTDTRCLIDGTT